MKFRIFRNIVRVFLVLHFYYGVYLLMVKATTKIVEIPSDRTHNPLFSNWMDLNNRASFIAINKTGVLDDLYAVRDVAQRESRFSRNSCHPQAFC